MAETAEATTFEQAFEKSYEDSVKAHSTEQATDTEDSDALATESGDTEAKTQPSEEDATAGNPKDEAADDQLLTEEEVAKLPDGDRETYKRMQAAYTRKTQDLASKRKAFEAESALLDSIKKDPQKGLEQLAEHLGLKVSFDQQETESQGDDFKIPDELNFLKPVFDQFEKSILSRVSSQYRPVLESSVKAETDAVMKEFGASYPDWKEHEPAMLQYMNKYRPADGVSKMEYLQDAYKAATADSRAGDEMRRIAERYRKSARASESERSGVSTDTVAPKAPEGKSFNATFDAAFEAAKRGEQWER